MPKPKILRFFLGANSSQGFVSRFDQLGNSATGWRTTIIKGGPGTGKSSAMKKLAVGMYNSCSYIEEIYCSSDVGSLDGVIFPEHKLSIADGTAPHGGSALALKFPSTLFKGLRYPKAAPLVACRNKRNLYPEKRIFLLLFLQEKKRNAKTASGYAQDHCLYLGRVCQPRCSR